MGMVKQFQDNVSRLFGGGKKFPLRSEIKIQGMGNQPEGAFPELDPASLLFYTRNAEGISGAVNRWRTYDGQVQETYRRYNNMAEFGSAQTRATVDLRTAFIVGEGINVSAKNPNTAEFLKEFLEDTKLNGQKLIDMVKSTEMAGQVILALKAVARSGEELQIKLGKLSYSDETQFRLKYSDDLFEPEIESIEIKKNANSTWQTFDVENFVYVKTGGDDSLTRGPTTRVGSVLQEIENYDRALKDIRRLNHVAARITPHFDAKTPSDAKTLKAELGQQSWTIGKALVTSNVEFSYKGNPITPIEGLEKEAAINVKTVSAVTGVPVHWLGFVDLMSNRATAESLYELIKQCTATERAAWEAALYTLLCKAMEMYVDNGGTLLDYDEEFSVKLPLLDFGTFASKIAAYSMAYADEAISLNDYRNAIPGIDPLQTQKDIEAEKNKLVKKSPVKTPQEFADKLTPDNTLPEGE